MKLTEPKRSEQFHDQLHRLFPTPDTRMKLCGTHAYNITIQVTEDCNLACTYCYQHDKSPKRLDPGIGKKFIDLILTADERTANYINSKEALGVTLDFIGGEPLLEIDTIEILTNYFIQRMIELEHPWATRFRISIGSNGMLYFDPKVQAFLKKHHAHTSMSITVDGNKEVHDACRIDHNGNGSYDRAMAAANHYQLTYGIPVGTKITISPDNLPKVGAALIEFAENGYQIINANYVYEDVWNINHAKELYRQLKTVADYYLDHDMDNDIWLSILDWGCGEAYQTDNSWCGGGSGLMLALDVRGDIYPCIRYTPSSMGNKQPPVRIGNVDRGIAITDEEKAIIHCLGCVTRSIQCTEKCRTCPIAMGCGDCAAYSYECTGKLDSRVTFICDMHKARSMASSYYRNKSFLKNKKKPPLPMNIPEDWALEIIDEEEYADLVDLATNAMAVYNIRRSDAAWH